jgi:serine protease SohB
MIWLDEYLLFLLKIVTTFMGFLLCFMVISQAKKKGGHEDDSPPHQLTIKLLNKKFDALTDTLQSVIMDKKAYKLAQKKQAKEKKKNKKQERPRSFLLHFKGDIEPHGLIQLSTLISTVLDVAKTEDEVILALESGGGTVHGYGLAAAQLERLRAKNIPLTIIIDKVAASGGYLMACVANRVVAAPFAVIGSIGVIMQQPNFHRFLQKKNIDFEQITAGEHKRNLSLFAANTTDGRKQAQTDVDQIHLLFKGFIKKYRPQLDVDSVGDGRVWHGSDALKLGLIDEQNTLAHILQQSCLTRSVYEIKMTRTLRLRERIQKQLNHVAGLLSGNTHDKWII